MSNAFFEPPLPLNEPIFDYEPGSEAKKELKQAIKILKSSEVDIPI